MAASLAGAAFSMRVIADIAAMIDSAGQGLLSFAALCCVLVTLSGCLAIYKADARTGLIVFGTVLAALVFVCIVVVMVLSKKSIERAGEQTEGTANGTDGSNTPGITNSSVPTPDGGGSAPVAPHLDPHDVPPSPPSPTPVPTSDSRVFGKANLRLKAMADGVWIGEKDKTCSVRLEIRPGQIIWNWLPEGGQAKPEILTFDRLADDDHIEAIDERKLDRVFDFYAGGFTHRVGKEGVGEDFRPC